MRSWEYKKVKDLVTYPSWQIYCQVSNIKVVPPQPDCNVIMTTHYTHYKEIMGKWWKRAAWCRAFNRVRSLSTIAWLHRYQPSPGYIVINRSSAPSVSIIDQLMQWEITAVVWKNPLTSPPNAITRMIIKGGKLSLEAIQMFHNIIKSALNKEMFFILSNHLILLRYPPHCSILWNYLIISRALRPHDLIPGSVK